MIHDLAIHVRAINDARMRWIAVAAGGGLASVSISFVMEPLFPPGDWRWYSMLVAGLVIVWVASRGLPPPRRVERRAKYPRVHSAIDELVSMAAIEMIPTAVILMITVMFIAALAWLFERFGLG